MNPVGNFTKQELGGKLFKDLNDQRIDDGKKPLTTFSVEDIKESGVNPDVLDSLLANKSGFNPNMEITPDNVLNMAAEKNIDPANNGFKEFLYRTTGEGDVNSMSPPQLHAAFKALSEIPKREEMTVLPSGTNATRFADWQYKKGVKTVTSEIAGAGQSDVALGVAATSVIPKIKEATGLTDHDVAALLRTAVQNGDLSANVLPGEVNKTFAPGKSFGRNIIPGSPDDFEVHLGLPHETTRLVSGLDIRSEQVQKGEQPSNYTLKAGDINFEPQATLEEAHATAQKLTELRQKQANQKQSEIEKLQSRMQKNLDSLDEHHALNGADLEYQKNKADINAENREIQGEIEKLSQERESLMQPVEVRPGEVKPVTEQRHTIYDKEEPIASFPTREAAEQHALSLMSDQKLQDIIAREPSVKGLMPYRLAVMAQKELASRGIKQVADTPAMQRQLDKALKSSDQKGIAVEATGSREEAAANLAKSGVQTPERRAQIEAEAAQKALFTEKVKKDIDALHKTLVPALEKLGLGKVGLRIVESIRNGTADGEYTKNLITIAMDSKNPLGTLRHESIHALKEMGAFTPNEWKILSNKAKSEWIGEYLGKKGLYDEYKKQYAEEHNGDLKGFQEYITEEAIAEAFKHFAETGKTPAGLIGNIRYRLGQFFERMRNSFNKLGYKNSSDIFKNIESGDQALEAQVLNRTRKSSTNSNNAVSSDGRYNLRPNKGEENGNLSLRESTVRPGRSGNEGIGRVDEQGGRRRGNGGGRKEVRSYTPLEGAPSGPVSQGARGPDAGLNAVAQRYLESVGRTHERQPEYAHVNEDRATRIAQAYEEMQHAPNDPKVKAAYADMMRQIKDQYKALKDAGYDFTFFDSKTDPYDGNPWNAMRDLRNNKRMAIYGTYDGFGAKGITSKAVKDNPLLANTGIKWKDQNGVERPVTANDLFRAVHDAFGHGLEGAGFRARGEENAWQAHSQMFTEPGLHALTSETRGQNSWVNYGPNGKTNRTAKANDTIFADQKTGLMPEWTWKEGSPRKFSLREGKEPLVLGEKQPEAMSYHGVHYGKASFDTLKGDKYGSGLKGAEAKRLDNSEDDRIKKRGYFYIEQPNGKRPVPEAGVGPHVHEQTFGNILGPGEEMTRLKKEANGDANKFESLIVDRGFDGYASPSMGMMVILNHDIPVEYLGTRAEVASKETQSLKALRAPTTPEFKEWFGDSKIVKKSGKPKVMYHGTSADIEAFKPRQANAIFVTDDPVFAEAFSGESYDYLRNKIIQSLKGDKNFVKELVQQAVDAKELTPELAKTLEEAPFFQAINSVSLKQRFNDFVDAQLAAHQNIIPVYVRSENPFDYQNPNHINELAKIIDDKYVLADVRGGDWEAIENPTVQEALRDYLGFDGFYVKEAGRKNLGVYNSSQLKSVFNERPNINEERIKYSLRDNTDSAINDAIDRVTTVREKPQTFIDRITSALSPDWNKLRQGLISTYDPIERQEIEIAKLHGEDRLLADVSAMGAITQAMRGAGIAAASFREGIPVFENGFTKIKTGTTSLFDALKPISEAGKGDPRIWQMFQYYAGAKRGVRLNAEGREETFTPKDYEYAKQLEADYPQFKEALEKYQEYNKGLVKYMKDTGVISDKAAEEFSKYMDYIPFYRQMDGEPTMGPRIFGPISGVAGPKKLEGGSYFAVLDSEGKVVKQVYDQALAEKEAAKIDGKIEKRGVPLADFLETVVRNARAAIDSGLKNEAGSRVVRNMLEMGHAEEVEKSTPGKDIINIKVKGETKYYRVMDPLMTEALKGLNLPQMPMLELFSKPAQLLRNMVTLEPGFVLSNLMRDSLDSAIRSGHGLTPFVDSFKQFGKILADSSPEAKELQRAGLGSYEFTRDIQSTAGAVAHELNSKTGNRSSADIAMYPLKQFKKMLEHASTASELSARSEIYKRVMKETGNEAEAIYQATELMNFDRKGSWAVARILSAMIPFLNARVQGLDILYRVGTGKMAMTNAENMQKMFATRSMQLLGMSAMYWYMVNDTDEYKNMTQEERDNNWIIPGWELNGKPFKIPIPFELGVLFKVLPERIMAYSLGNDTGKDFSDSMKRQVAANLSFNPMPQAALPLYENMSNYSTFTGKPIVGRGMEKLEPQYQYSPNTTEVAKLMGKEFDYSPLKIDHLISGYTGNMGLYAAQLLDSSLGSLNNQGERASKRFEQMPVIKRFFASDSGTIENYYELKHRVDQVVATANDLAKTGNPEQFKEYVQQNQKIFGLRDWVTSMDNTMNKLRQYQTFINNSKTMSAEEKRERLDKIHDMQMNLTKNVQELRKKATQ